LHRFRQQGRVASSAVGGQQTRRVSAIRVEVAFHLRERQPGLRVSDPRIKICGLEILSGQGCDLHAWGGELRGGPRRKSKTIHGVVAFALQLIDLCCERALPLLEGSHLGPQVRSLAGLVDRGADGGRDCDGNENFLKRSHGESLGGGSGCAGDNGCSRKGGNGGNRKGKSGRGGLDGVGGDEQDERARADGDAALGEDVAQTFDRPVDALLCSIFARAESVGHFAGGLAFEVTEQQGVAVRIVQFAEGGIELRGDLVPKGIGLVHGSGFLFARAPADFGANGFGGQVSRRAMQPACQDRAIHELAGVPGQQHEHALGYVFGQVRVANHSHRGGIHEIDVPFDQPGERIFRAAFGVSLQQVLVGRIVHFIQ